VGDGIGVQGHVKASGHHGCREAHSARVRMGRARVSHGGVKHKLNIGKRSIANKYHEGKMKR
jgi:hypothetical protein